MQPVSKLDSLKVLTPEELGELSVLGPAKATPKAPGKSDGSTGDKPATDAAPVVPTPPTPGADKAAKPSLEKPADKKPKAADPAL